MLIFLFITLGGFYYTFSCSTTYEVEYPKKKSTTTSTTEKMPKMFRGNQQWEPHVEERAKWSRWYKDYLAKQNLLKQKDEEGLQKGIIDPDDGTKPRLWTQIPPGRDGDDPPPWAIAAKSHGKPHYCFQPPDTGVCPHLIYYPYKTFMIRWGYNYFKGDCEEFKFSQCGGNDNNFMSKRRCEEACLKIPSTLCLNYGGRRKIGTMLTGKQGC